MHRSIFLLAILIGLMTSHEAAYAQEVGWIDDYQDPDSTSYIIRQKNKLPLRILEPIQVGDEIVVVDELAFVGLRLGQADQVKINMSNSPYHISAQQSQTSISSNLLSWASSWLDGRHKALSQDATVSLVTRSSSSPPLRIPMTSETKSAAPRVSARNQSLFFPKEGGRPPYKAEIKSPSMVVVSSENVSTNGSIIRFNALSLEEGIYEISITDASDEIAKGYFEASHDVPRNQTYARASNANTTDPLDTILKAYWLAAQEEGAWRLESYQLLAPLLTEFKSADTLARAIINGYLPQIN